MDKLSVRYLKGVGPKKEKVLNRLGIYSVADILYWFPVRYQDRRDVCKISQLKEGEPAVVRARVMACNFRPLMFRKGKKFNPRASIFEIVISDDSGYVFCVWFNQPYIKDYIKVGDEIVIYGKPRLHKGSVQFVAPEFEVLDKSDTSSGMKGIIPVYRLTEGLTQKLMRNLVRTAWEEVGRHLLDVIPFSVRKERKFPNIIQSLKYIHFPESFEEAELARRRFIFEELFLSQILVYMRKAMYRRRRSVPFKVNREVIARLEGTLGFELTPSQKKVIKEIFDDIVKPYPMHRLLQGDVGCGKTVVASFAMAVAVDNGYQVAFMVPTEVLATQHVQTLRGFFKDMKVQVEMLSSGLSLSQKKTIRDKLAGGEIDIIVGTHSLLEEDVKFKNLGLVVIDEQHKFGVAQRALLPRKGEKIFPHCLVMSATPIPRSFALSLYGDLDLSAIKELPPGRKMPQTIWVEEEKREWVYEFIREKLSEGRQAYIIYPLIEESDLKEIKSLRQMHTYWEKVLSPFTVGVFHGRMSGRKKTSVIRKFRDKKIDVLISTTVIEVGVNIENATVMVVENPERFGLAQLHQLRGRIRRSVYEPYFILLSKRELSENARRRLEVISQYTDGFIIAEEDLKIRGPGDFFGHIQSGFPQLKMADPLRDLETLNDARRAAYSIIKEDPHLEKPAHHLLKEHLQEWWRMRGAHQVKDEGNKR